MKNSDRIAELLLKAGEGADIDTMRRLISVAEEFGDLEIVRNFRKKLADLIVRDPTPEKDRNWSDTDDKVQKLTGLGALPEAVDIALSGFLFFPQIFYDLVLKVHEAGMAEAEKALIKQFRERLELEIPADLPPDDLAFLNAYSGRNWVLRKGLTPEVHAILGFDVLSVLKDQEAFYFSEDYLVLEPMRRSNNLCEYFDLLFLYARFGFLEEAERFRLLLWHQFDAESEKPVDHKQVFPGPQMSNLARLPDGFTPEGKAFYRCNEQGNLYRAVEQMIRCPDVSRIDGEFDMSCVSIFEEQSKDFLDYSTDVLTAAIPRIPEGVLRTKLYDSLFSRRHEFLSVEAINSLMHQAVEALRNEIEPENRDGRLHFWILQITQRDAATALEWCLEQNPEAREESAESIAYWLESPEEAKNLISLFSEPRYREFFHHDFIPKFLEMKLAFPVQWIDEQIVSAKKRNDVRREADLSISRFIRQSLCGLPDEAKRSFDAAMEIIRTIDTDAKKSAKREQEWLKRLPENSFPDYESDTEWKPEALLRAVKALAFVGQVDEALGFEEEYVRSEKDAFDFAAKGLAKQTLIGPSVQEDRKERYEQAKSVFRLEIVSSMIQSDTKY